MRCWLWLVRTRVPLTSPLVWSDVVDLAEKPDTSSVAFSFLAADKNIEQGNAEIYCMNKLIP